MRLNKKGFTLVELLVTIVIVGLVIGISTYGIITAINDSEDKSKTISLKNIKEAASIYSSEADSSSWKNADSYDAFCVTVGELMNKGLLDANAKIKDKVDKDTFIMVKRNKVTLALESENLVGELGTEENEICTGQKVAPGEDITTPKITGSTSHTDQIVINFNAGSATYQGSNSNVSYTCLYGNSSASITKEAVVEGNSCKLNNLKSNTTYYVYVYMKTERGSVVLATGTNEYKTTDFNKTTFTQNKNTVTVNYNDKDSKGITISPAYHYVKSNTVGVSSANVEKCTLDNEKFTCDGSTTNIESNIWYKVSGASVNITYAEETNTGINISTRIYDGSNNYKENSENFVVNKYTIKFYKNNAQSIDDKTSEYVEKYCISAGTKSCNITSPSIKPPSGYSVVGWNTNKDATSSSWNVNVQKEVKANASYYAILKINKVYINYNPNGGSVTSETTSDGVKNTWKTDSSGVVLKNDKKYTTSLNYGTTSSVGALANYNNSTNLDIKLKGYTASQGEEWKCMSGCTNSNATFDQQNKAYKASDFCDASISNCTVILGVNWKIVNYTITYNLNGGSVSGNPTSYNVETATFTLNNPTRTGYTFTGWTGTGLSSASKEVKVNKGSTGNKSYTANWSANSYTYNIVYKSSSGTQLGTDTIKKNYGTTNTVSPKSFTGYTSPSVQSIKWDSTSAKTITFTYTPINYTISYDLAGGSVSGNPTSYNIETSSITLKNPTRTGYTFTGWTGSNGSTKQTSVTISKGSTGNKSYTANWSANSYTYNIVYKSSSGTQLGTDTIKKNYGTTNTVSPKSFTGYTSPSVQSIKWDSTSAKTITFTYTPINYTISYDLAGGSVSGNPTSYNIETSSITLKNPTKTGNTFAGWTGSNGSTKQTSVTISKGSTGNKSYTANWSASTLYVSDAVDSYLNCRSGAGTGFGSVTTYQCGKAVSGSYFNNSWYYHQGGNCYLSAEYLSTTRSCTYYVTTNELRCRTGPGTGYDVKTYYNCGKSFTGYPSDTSGWIYYPGNACYLSSSYISSTYPSCSSSSGGGTSGGGGTTGGGETDTCVAGRCKCQELCGSDYACYKDGTCNCCASLRESPCFAGGGPRICSIHNVPM